MVSSSLATEFKETLQIVHNRILLLVFPPPPPVCLLCLMKYSSWVPYIFLAAPSQMMQHTFFMYNKRRISFYFISTEINIQALMLCTGDWGWVCFLPAPHHLEWIIKHVRAGKRWKDLSPSWSSSTEGCVKWTRPGCWLTLSRVALGDVVPGGWTLFETLSVHKV